VPRRAEKLSRSTVTWRWVPDWRSANADSFCQQVLRSYLRVVENQLVQLDTVFSGLESSAVLYVNLRSTQHTLVVIR